MFATHQFRPFRGLAAVAVIVTFCTSCFDGNPIFAPPLGGSEVQVAQWKWYDIDGSICRDGSPTGIGLRVDNPKKLAIYLNGGGACFNDLTCAVNPDSFNEENFEDLVANNQRGMFDLERDENPIKGWSTLFIPYCTGDVHMGTRYLGTALGVEEKQAYVGAHNFQKALNFVKPYFDAQGIDEILLFGISAGGYGVYNNFIKVKNAFPNAKLTVINDSGPLFNDDQAFAPCLQLGFLAIFGVQIPQGIISVDVFSDWLTLIYEYSSNRYPDTNFGFISSLEDNVSRYFLSFGYNNCSGAPDNQIPADKFSDALLHLRDSYLIPRTRWSTFYINGTSHGMFDKDELTYELEVDGKYLYEWVEQVLAGDIVHLQE